MSLLRFSYTLTKDHSFFNYPQFSFQFLKFQYKTSILKEEIEDILQAKDMVKFVSSVAGMIRTYERIANTRQVFTWGNGRKKRRGGTPKMDTGCSGRHTEYAHWKVVGKDAMWKGMEAREVIRPAKVKSISKAQSILVKYILLGTIVKVSSKITFFFSEGMVLQLILTSDAFHSVTDCIPVFEGGCECISRENNKFRLSEKIYTHVTLTTFEIG